MLSRDSSLRLSLLSFPLIVGVVYMHVHTTTVVLSGADLSISHPSFFLDFLSTLIAQSVTRVTLPLFFLVSGFLFFLDLKWSKENYVAKLRTRAKTLLVPFLFWNILTLGFLAAAQANHVTRPYFSGKSSFIETYTLRDYLTAIFGINRYPVAYQFWFVRDLMALVLLSPLIAFMIRKAWIPFLMVAFSCWFVKFDPVYFPNAEAILFFSIGGWFASSGQDIFRWDKYGRIALLFYVPLSVLDALSYQWPFNFVFHKTALLAGAVIGLLVTKYFAKVEPLKRALVWLSGVAFWVYATHEPILTTSKRLIYKVLRPDSSLLVLVINLCLPVLVILASIGLRQVIYRVSPRLTDMVTGGRSPKQQQKIQASAMQEVQV